jgi:methylated-DNA-[protein]-cysteine S-methyltransferase
LARSAPSVAPAPAWTWAATALGRWLVAATPRGVCYLGLDGEGSVDGLRRWALRWCPGSEPQREDAGLPAEAAEQLEAYAQGRLRRFGLPLDLRGSAFQRAVWSELLAIPFGGTRTYGQVAARLARPGASRAVGAAAGRNPVPVIVPCHRLVAADGLGGFSAGPERKRALLGLERGQPHPQGELAFEPPARR